MSVEVKYLAAKAKLRKSNVWECDYSGPINMPAAAYLGKVVRGKVGVDSMVERVDKALWMTAGYSVPQDIEWLRKTKPSAIVCRQDQLDDLLYFTRMLADLGVVRVCFLDPDLAASWAGSFQSQTQ